MGGTVKVKLDMKPTSEILSRRGLERGGRVQQHVATQVAAGAHSYVPFRTGRLADTAIANLSPPYEDVVYDGPYARRHYYNTGGVDRRGRNFSSATFVGAPRRGAQWVMRWWADNRGAFLSNLQAFVNRGGR
ncbi:MAG: minor capsid protein [Oscillospiraceae bacterium]|nr:minor capsid protein [Oscillospiraceae bacterium]